MADITYIETEERVCYLSLITDAYSHKIVGWAVGPTLEVIYPLQALKMAIDGIDDVTARGLIHHSDRGCQYCCNEYVTELKKLEDTEEQHSEYDVEQQSRVITEIKEELQKSDVKDIVQADHLADTLLQNISLGKVINSAVEGNVLRDQLMAENVLWILSMEEQRGNSCIFISGHNGHIERFGNYGAGTRVMGNILSDELGDGYFAIGTDFYKTNCNLPKNDGKRITHTFYSYDPLAKAAKKAGYDMSWLDFSKVPENSQLKEQITDHVSMGSLGEGYSAIFMGLFPRSYRISQSPEKLYDGMIFVTDAHPIEIREEISEK